MAPWEDHSTAAREAKMASVGMRPSPSASCATSDAKAAWADPRKVAAEANLATEDLDADWPTVPGVLTVSLFAPTKPGVLALDASVWSVFWGAGAARGSIA